jgi:hypothetical protein
MPETQMTNIQIGEYGYRLPVIIRLKNGWCGGPQITIFPKLIINPKSFSGEEDIVDIKA